MSQDGSKLHHVVFAVAAERHATVAQMFTELGFSFDSTELTELGVTVSLDWNHGLELISAVPGSAAEVAASVNDFLDRHGDGVYTVILQVPERIRGRGCHRALRVDHTFSAELRRRGFLLPRNRLVGVRSAAHLPGDERRVSRI